MVVKKLRLGTASLGGCLGCHMSFLDLDETLLDLVEEIEIVFSPLLMDVKEPPSVDVFLIEGAVTNVEDEELLKKIRERCKLLVALGDCACLQGIMLMRNLFGKQEVLRRAYVESESTKDGKVPSGKEVPSILERAKPVDRVVKVDCYVPGCPPAPKIIRHVLKELRRGKIPKVPRKMLHYD